MEKQGATAWHSPDRYVQFFALITVTLQANTFQKGQQIAITCSVINHMVHHWLPSCIPNDNHKLAWQTASPSSTSPFCHSCQKLCAALLWLITPLLVEVVSHPGWHMCAWAGINAGVLGELPNILKQIVWGKGGGGEQKKKSKTSGSPQAKLPGL